MHKNMFSHLISFVLGFGAGRTITELLKKNKTSATTSVDGTQSKQLSATSYNEVSNENIGNQNTNFSLQSLKEIFDSYNVKIINAGSFGILLNEIRSSCHKDLLKSFLYKADTPETLIEMLKTQTTSNIGFSINHSTSAPSISREQLDSYLVKEGVSASEFDSNSDKIKFLLSLYYAKGIDDFKNTLGPYLSDILSAHERGVDITERYENIMKIIRSRYGYLS